MGGALASAQACVHLCISCFLCSVASLESLLMARLARCEIFDPREVAVVHVMNRVCRRCFLLGDEPVSRKSSDNRNFWCNRFPQRFHLIEDHRESASICAAIPQACPAVRSVSCYCTKQRRARTRGRPICRRQIGRPSGSGMIRSCSKKPEASAGQACGIHFKPAGFR